MYLNKQGVGLSLCIANLIARQMEGKCSFRSKEGKYTKFFFQINAESVDEVEVDQVKFKLEEIAEEEEAKSIESS